MTVDNEPNPHRFEHSKREDEFCLLSRLAISHGSIISVVGKSTLEMMGLFHADKKSHMTYNEKQQNNSLESIIWNTLR
ncbi:hypothetical protein, partial [Streptococcus halichoeri]|uniref:hypothetical protein n=1 Tax=Streptococcus halichoeri TaxID=254785 RepID=UPI001F160F65